MSVFNARLRKEPVYLLAKAIAMEKNLHQVISMVACDIRLLKEARRLYEEERSTGGFQGEAVADACRLHNVPLDLFAERLRVIVHVLNLTEHDTAQDEDYYAKLGVDRQAGPEEVKHAFRRLSLACHPDMNPGDREAAVRFRDLYQAYQVLSNEKLRLHYDNCTVDHTWREDVAEEEEQAAPSKWHLLGRSWQLGLLVVLLMVLCFVVDYESWFTNQHYQTRQRVPSEKPVTRVVVTDVGTEHGGANYNRHPAKTVIPEGEVSSIVPPIPQSPQVPQTVGGAERYAGLADTGARNDGVIQEPTDVGASLKTANEVRTVSSLAVPDTIETHDKKDLHAARTEARTGPADPGLPPEGPKASSVDQKARGTFDGPQAASAAPETGRPSQPKAVEQRPKVSLDSPQDASRHMPAAGQNAPKNGPSAAHPAAGRDRAVGTMAMAGKPTVGGPPSKPRKAYGLDAQQYAKLPPSPPSPGRQTGQTRIQPSRKSVGNDPTGSRITGSADDLNERILAFLDRYVNTYVQKNPSAFLSLFEPDALENGKPVRGLAKTYRDTFHRAEKIRYGIQLVKYAASDQEVDLNGKLQLSVQFTGESLMESAGSIRMRLVRRGSDFRVKSLDYDFH